jgi:hypothetical protein
VFRTSDGSLPSTYINCRHTEKKFYLFITVFTHRERMSDERIPKQMMKYQPREYRSIGYPRKRWMEM